MRSNYSLCRSVYKDVETTLEFFRNGSDFFNNFMFDSHAFFTFCRVRLACSVDLGLDC